jgi:hypothetical protein
LPRFDLETLLVPAESAGAEPEPDKAKRENVTSTVSADTAARLKELAKRRGGRVSALLAPIITEFAAIA